jgi:7-cyano-7-deazaguanine synthase in queuosine biosynthesis
MQLEFDHPDFQRPKHAVVSLSGGMDSSTLLLRCLENFETVTALSFDYGQKHRVELKRASALVDYLRTTKAIMIIVVMGGVRLITKQLNLMV